MTKNKTHRFEVSLADRLTQRKEANNAVRMPRLGFKQYRVYNLESEQITTTFTLQKNRGQRSTLVTALPPPPATGAGPFIISSRQNSGKSKFILNQMYGKLTRYVSQQQLRDIPLSKVKWLKPKHVTMLKLKGHLVEEL